MGAERVVIRLVEESLGAMPCCCCGGKPDAEELPRRPTSADSQKLEELKAFNDRMTASHPGKATPEILAKLKEEEEALVKRLERFEAGADADARRHVGEHSDAGSNAPSHARRSSASKSYDFAKEGPDIPACLAHAAIQLQMAYPAAHSGPGKEAPIAVPVGNMHSGAVVCRAHAFSAFREIRASCNIAEADFFKSLENVTEIGNPGKGGQRLFRTADRQFFLKSMAGIELTMLRTCPRLVSSRLASPGRLCSAVL